MSSLSNFCVLVLLVVCATAAPAIDQTSDKAAAPQGVQDLQTDASSYVRTYSSDWGGSYPSNNYNYITGYGLLDDKYGAYNGGYGGYSGFNGYSGGNAGSTGYGYKGYGGYDSGIGYGQNTFGANGGYGGYGGNGGINSYYGYNNPSYQGAYHLGYGYRKPGYGNIYNSGITPSLVTGYRGYSRR